MISLLTHSEMFSTHQSRSCPIYGNPLASRTIDIHKSDDLQRQIDILKSVSNQQIEMLKARIYFLENKLKEVTTSNLDPDRTGDGKHRHGSATSFTSNQSTLTNTTNNTMNTKKSRSLLTNISSGTRKSHRVQSPESISGISSLSAPETDMSHIDLDPDALPGDHPKVISRRSSAHSIEMSEDRVRKLRGQVDPHHIKELIAEYDDDRKMGLEDVESDGLISPSDEASSTMDDRERAEIQTFKSKLDNLDAKVDGDSENENAEMREKKESKHNLMREQSTDEWDAATMSQTAEDMKKHLFHLALQTSLT